MTPRSLAPLALLAFLAPVLNAQAQGGETDVPAGYEPPPGMCRIWIDGVPADRQPAPTDCATAVRRRPANAHVVFGTAAATTNASQVKPGTSGSGAPLTDPSKGPPVQSEPQKAPAPQPPPPPRAAPPQNVPTHAAPPMHVPPAMPRPATTPGHTPATHGSPAGASSPAAGHPPMQGRGG